MEIKKEYTNGEVTVVWQPKICIHSAICAKGLPQVFKPKEKPWVKVDAATTQQIVNQVNACPSGALSYYMNNKKATATTPQENTKVEVVENGPLLVYGLLEVNHKDGSTENKKRSTAFCRCGFSNNKPYCDGNHNKEGFVG
jgi:uncharacterized Fe-S cluster protein YjdI